MSWCRFSSDNFRCDLYVYESDDGFAVHVASNRHMGPLLEFPYLGDIPSDADGVARWTYLHQAATRPLEDCPTIPIGGPYDGQAFYALAPDELVETLEMLRDAGYLMPRTLIDDAHEVLTATLT